MSKPVKSRRVPVSAREEEDLRATLKRVRDALLQRIDDAACRTADLRADLPDACQGDKALRLAAFGQAYLPILLKAAEAAEAAAADAAGYKSWAAFEAAGN